MNLSNFTFLTCNYVYVVSRASVTWQECNTQPTDMAAGEKIATLKIKAPTVSQAGAKIQKKYVFTISEVKEPLETHTAEQSIQPLKVNFTFSLSGLDRATWTPPFTSVMLSNASRQRSFRAIIRANAYNKKIDKSNRNTIF